MRALAVLAVLVVAGWAWTHHEHTANEHALAAAASEIVGRPVGVDCQGFFASLVDINDRKGEVQFPPGHPPDHMFLTRDTCGALKRFRTGHRGLTLGAAEAINTLTHEAFHLRGVTSESATQCYAIQTDAWTVVRLGGTPVEGAALASIVFAEQPNMPSEYQSSDCRAGGSLDLHPETAAFPTETPPQLPAR